MPLRLGTRRSLLARAQSLQVARAIESLNPGVQVELVGIETQGDRIQDIPLQKVEGKDFFVAELDRALCDSQVDLTVHSFKDLSLERDSRIVCAAIPERVDPRDVILFSPSAQDRLISGEPIRVGTSSPRRLENIPPFLERVLPRFGIDPNVLMVEIRGNVNTRISRLHEPEDSPKKLDGVVLALAGLDRLNQDQEGKAELRKLLTKLRWMVLPLKECPTAAAQGALSIECRSDDRVTFEIIRKLHCSTTESHVMRERQLLSAFGGGCHQKFGSTCIHHPELGELFFVRGENPEGNKLDELHWHAPAKPPTEISWDGTQYPASSEPITDGQFPSVSATFVAHNKAVHGPWLKALAQARVWASGTASWEKLAEQGLWVEGSAEGLGFDFIKDVLNLTVLNLPPLNQWTALTHEGAVGGWVDLKAVGTYYSHAPTMDEEGLKMLRSARLIFWASGSQYDRLGSESSPEAKHACGPGKTAQHLRDKGIEPLIFPSVEEWRVWAKN